jgi:Domain of unknown function (DUF4340)
VTARRLTWLLIAAVALVVFAIWIASRRHLERAIVAGDLVLPGLEHEVNAVTVVRLRKAGDVHTTLQKGGDDWSVAERGWPADLSKVRKLLLNLGALNIVEEKTRLAVHYPELGVEDVSQPKATGTRIEVVTPTRAWALIVGKSSSAKSGYVRIADAQQSLLAAPLLSVDADPKTWLDQTLIDLPATRVRQIEEKPADGPPYSASREKKEDSNYTVSPLPKGRVLTGPAAAEPIAGALGSLTLDDVQKAGAADTKAGAADTKAGAANTKAGAADTKAAAGAKASVPEAKTAHALFHTFDGLDVDVAGRKDGTRSLVMISARSTAPATAAEAQKLNARLAGWEFEIPDYKYSVIFMPLEELLQKPPEPAKKPAVKGKGAAAPHKSTTGADKTKASEAVSK